MFGDAGQKVVGGADHGGFGAAAWCELHKRRPGLTHRVAALTHRVASLTHRVASLNRRVATL